MKETPKYLIIANHIRQQILSGELHVDQQLPREMTMTKTYNASRITIRKALDELEADGLIYKIQGSGTFVKSKEIGSTATSELAIDIFDTKKMDIINSEITVSHPQENDAKRLQVPTSTFVYEISRVFVAHDAKEPIVYQELYLPLQYIQGISVRQNERSIYDFLVEEINLELVASHREYQAVPSPDFVAKSLGIKPKTFLLNIEQTVSIENGQIVLLSKNWFNPSMGPFSTNLLLK
ncbi:GntR family transcriptional regulator [Lacticaseibacillus chiayiensis]|uniref:GntR family transcriptional regulator n=1 Tax=Lacticaseibacillus chiayiensis TaxID=2100821 RepID=UPI003C72C786